MNVDEFRRALDIKLIKDQVKENNFLYKEFSITHGGRNDILYFTYDNNGVTFESHEGIFDDTEFEIIKEHLLFEGHCKLLL
jgi:hypothetical protein